MAAKAVGYQRHRDYLAKLVERMRSLNWAESDRPAVGLATKTGPYLFRTLTEIVPGRTATESCMLRV